MDGTGGMVNRDALNGYVDRIEALHNERDELNESIREVYKEAKDAGFDTTVVREIVRELRMERDARLSRYALLDSYRQALGMLADTPLGEAALSRPLPFARQPMHRERRRPGRPRKQQPAQEAEAPQEVSGDPIADAMARHQTGDTARAADFRQ
jgi:uncharacterized protein (UPF0335 family)